MKQCAPARAPPPGFYRCTYCPKSFGTGAARRAHETSSAFCIAEQLRQIEGKGQLNGQESWNEKKKKQPAADDWEDFGGDDWGQEELAPRKFEAMVDGMIDLVFDEENEDEAPEDEGGGLNQETKRDFDSVDELVLAFQIAGRREKPLTRAGQGRVLRVLNHPEYCPAQVAKELPTAEHVTRRLAEMNISKKVNLLDLAEPGDPGPLWCAYIDGAEAYQHMFSEPEAARGFFLRPKKLEDPTRKNDQGGNVRIYGEVRRGTWWEKADRLVVERERDMDRQEGLEPATVFAGPYILHYDKTYVDAVGNYVMAPLYMSLGNYSRHFIGKARKGYLLVAFLPVPKPEAFAKGWTKNTPAFRYKARYYVNKGLATFNEPLRNAGHTGLMCPDPSGELRKVYPLPFIFAMDLGEQYVVAGVMAQHCAAWEVPPAKYADLRAARVPGYPPRTVKGMREARQAMRKMSLAERTKEASRVGVFPTLKVFLENTAFQDELPLQEIFLGPDELHVLYGGLLGNHFYKILRTCAPRGHQVKLLEALDRGVHYAYTTDKPPTLRLPSNKTHFSTSHNCSHREKAGVLQILACILANLCKDDERGDILVNWVNALNRWINITLWNKEPDDLSLEESDRLLFQFQDACDATAHLRKGKKGDELGWRFLKMFQLSLYKPATIRNGHGDFSNTDLGERAHEFVKGLFAAIGAKPSELIPRMVNQWQLSLAADRLKANSWFQGREKKKQEYRSSDERAFDTGNNQLPMTSSTVVRLSDFGKDKSPRLGVSLARAQKSLRAWKRYTPPWTPRLAPEELNKDGSVKRQPLSHFYKQLPEQIGFFILREVQGLGPREVSAYARSVRSERAAWPAPEDGRLYICYTLYVAPSEDNGRVETHRLRACPAFSGRPVFHDVAVKSPEGGGEEGGERKRKRRQGGGGDDSEPWIGKVLMLFRIKVKRRAVKVLEGRGRPQAMVFYPLALVRWYQRLPRVADASRCPVYRWEARPDQPCVSVIDIRSITEIVHMLPVPVPATFGQELDLYYRNIWLRKELPY